MTGCYAQVSSQQISHIPEVDYVVGLGRLADLLQVVKGEVEEKRVFVSNLRRAEQVDTFGTLTFSSQTRAFLKSRRDVTSSAPFVLFLFPAEKAVVYPHVLCLSSLIF
jgi:hypothetical protein